MKTCTVDKVIFQKDEYVVLNVTLDDGSETVAAGYCNEILKEGVDLEMEGSWKSHPKYGDQFSITYCHSVVNNMRHYLRNGMVTGIGPALADRIIEEFGESTQYIFDKEPEKLLKVNGIAKKKLIQIKDSWSRSQQGREEILYLQRHGLTPTISFKVYKHFGNKTIPAIEGNPYVISEVSGVGFKKADEFAENFGIRNTDPRRICEGIKYTIDQATLSGHCYLPEEELVDKSSKTLNINEELIRPCLSDLVFSNELIKEEDCYFLPLYYHTEIKVAKNFKRLLRKAEPLPFRGFDNDFIEENDDQIIAIQTAMEEKVMVLTGGPGTGKTTITKEIISDFIGCGLTIALAAPTGRAAKRMSEACGMTAKTIHRLLSYDPLTGKFQYGDRNKLPYDTYIIDEASMIDILLMNALLSAIPDHARLILVGDVNQLPSVGAGNVLNDIIESGAVPVVKLNKIFRQEAGSFIITNSHRINNGYMPDLSNTGDFNFIERQEGVNDLICDLVTRVLPEKYGIHPLDIQVLSPMKKGPCGTVELNRKLQNFLNPGKDQEFRLGDKVMQLKNNYEKEVFNGDIGIVKAVRPGEIYVDFGEGIIPYTLTESKELTLAYACTIHKSQGSEYPMVIIPMVSAHYIMQDRKLLYTAVTRAKNRVVIVGQKKAIAMAVHNDRTTERFTRLRERIASINDRQIAP